jgi:citrate lyase subunit beta/citryl-CoA lyase
MQDLDFVAPLFVPGDRPERFAKAAGSLADAVIIDLEDAVSPDRKEIARAALRIDFTDKPVVIRVNAVGTSWHPDDLDAVLQLAPAAVMIPKSVADAAFAASLARIAPVCAVIALVESGQGIADVRHLAGMAGVRRMAFGSLDFCADIGAQHTRDALLMARSEIVLASRLAARLAPLDGVTMTTDAQDAIRDDALYSRSLGFGGKLAIHPRQVPSIMTGFQPTAAELHWANEVLSGGDGVLAIQGAMVDEPVRIAARTILARAQQSRQEEIDR